MEIKKTQAMFGSTNGLTDIRTLIWTPENPKAMLLIAPGVTDHMGRYDEFARYMAGRGFLTFGCDPIGHGGSCTTMLQLGDFAEPDTDVRMVDDLHMLIRIMRRRQPDLPLFLLGHDMGALLVRLHTVDFPDEASGVVLCSSPNAADILSRLEPFIDAVGGLIDTNMYTDRAGALFEKITARILGDSDETAWLARSEQAREQADLDPYFGYPITYGSVLTLAKLLLRSASDGWFSRYPKALPTLIIGGGRDPVTGMGRAVLQICDRLENAGCAPETRLYPGMRHDLLREDDRRVVYEDIADFLDACLMRKGADA